MKPDYHVYITDLGSSVNEVVVPEPDGDYTIYINAQRCREEQAEAYFHAVRHIENHDCENDIDVNAIEVHRHDTD